MKKSIKRNKSKRLKQTKHIHKKGYKCLICLKKKSMKGGSCSSCLNLKGGNFYKTGYAIPGPFVGKPWNTQVKDWPGVNGIGGDRNYLKYNNYLVDPQTATRIEGGSKSKKGKKSKKNKSKRRLRGGLIPQDLVNVGRDIKFNMGSAYNSLNGYPAPVNPLPYKDQLINSGSNNLRSLL